MIKLGIFGDQTTNLQLLEQIKNLSDTELVGIHFTGNAVVPDGFIEIMSPHGLMDISDAILIVSDISISNDLARVILRKSKHLFLKTIPNILMREIKELIDLEKEAGIVSLIYNPFSYIPCFDPFLINYEKPFLLNIRNCFANQVIKTSHEMLLLVTALDRVIQSNVKKMDVFGLRETENKIYLNLRIEYDNSCVINLTLTDDKIPGSCEVVEKRGRTKFEFDTPMFNSFSELTHEFIAVSNFIESIRNQDKRTSTLDSLHNGIQIVHEIREQLLFRGIDF